MGLPPYVESAMKGLGVTRDGRGLMALAEARRRVRRVTVFEQGRSHRIAGQAARPTDADYLWAALLSLEDGAEFVRHATRLRWKHSPRGVDNVALVERYGEAVLPWLEASIRNDGRLPASPRCIRPCLLFLGAPAARAVLRVRDPHDDDPDGFGLLNEWLRAHGSAAWSSLAAEARSGNAAARTALVALVRRSPASVRRALTHAKSADVLALLAGKADTELSAEAILRVLDAAASAEVGERVPWPMMRAAAGHFEYHAMRLTAVRAARGDDWGILIEVVQGDTLDREARWPAVVQRYAYGSHVPSGGRYQRDGKAVPVTVRGDRVTKPVKLALDAGTVETLDLRPGRSITGAVENWPDVLAIRAALAMRRDAFFSSAAAIAKHLRVRRAKVVVTAEVFEHTDGPAHGVAKLARLPSKLKSYRTLAAAIAARDPELFDPGRANTDWRAHAKKKQSLPADLAESLDSRRASSRRAAPRKSRRGTRAKG